MCRIAEVKVIVNGQFHKIVKSVQACLDKFGDVTGIHADAFSGSSHGSARFNITVDDHHADTMEHVIATIAGVEQVEVTHYAATFARTPRKGIPV